MARSLPTALPLHRDVVSHAERDVCRSAAIGGKTRRPVGYQGSELRFETRRGRGCKAGWDMKGP